MKMTLLQIGIAAVLSVVAVYVIYRIVKSMQGNDVVVGKLPDMKTVGKKSPYRHEHAATDAGVKEAVLAAKAMFKDEHGITAVGVSREDYQGKAAYRYYTFTGAPKDFHPKEQKYAGYLVL